MATLADDFTDNTGTAGKLSLNGTANGNFESSVDEDWFAVDLQAGTRYVFAIQSAVRNDYSSSTQFTLALHDAGGVQVGDLVSGANGALPAIDFTAPATGKYYVAAGSKYSSVYLGSYQVAATVYSGADDFSADTASTGKLGSDGMANGTFNMAGDRDWIRFHAVPTSHYAFSWASGVAPAMTRIFDASGKLALDDAWSFDVAKEGDYFLEVMGLQTGAYSMALKEWKDDFPDTDAGAGTVVAGGKPISAALDYPNDVDRFKVQLEAGKYYSIVVANQYGPQMADIFDPSGNMFGSIGLTTGSDGVTRQAGQSGTYYISVKPQMTTIIPKDPVPYTVKVSQGVVDDIGDTPATALAAQVGVAARGTLQSARDVDLFKVALQAGVTYSFAAEGSSQDSRYLKFDITGADSKVLGHYRYWTSGSYTFTPATSGDYYAAVAADSYVPANYAYTFKVGTPPDDAGANAAGAVYLPVGATLTGKLEDGGGDVDWYAVYLSAGTTYWIDADSVSMSNSSDGLLRVLDATGGELARARSTFFSSFSDTMAFVPSSSGTYYLELSAPKRATGSYTVSVKTGERDDAGDTVQTAVVLAPGASISGKLELGSDKDMYKIPVTPGMTYMLTVQPGVNGNPDIAIVDGSGKAIPFQDLWTGVAWPNHLLFTGPADGNAYVAVSQEDGDRGTTYTLATTAYAVDDYSADKNTAGMLAPGSSVQGAISHPTDGDWVRTPLEAGKTYAFQLLGVDSGGGTLASSRDFKLGVIGDGYTWTGVSAAAIKNAVEARVMFTAAKTGDYYVDVGGYGLSEQGKDVLGSYTLRALQTSGDTAAPVVVAQSHQPDAKDVALTDTRITLRFNEPVSIDRSAITVTDSQGKALSLTGDGVAVTPYVNDSTVVLKVPGMFKPGTYTVHIPHDAIFDLAGNQYTGPESIRFTTVLPAAAGTPGADLLAGGKGAGQGLTIDGGSGIDTVMYDNYYYNKIERTATQTKVYLDWSGAADTLTNVERLLFDTRFYALDIDGNAGQAYRLYQAAFNRRPDSGGLGYWIAQLDKGAGLNGMARGFVASAEFKSLYGAAPGDDAFVTLLYNNVLHREPEAAGHAYWTNALHGGLAREDALVMFSESPENKAAVLDVIGNGFAYTPYAG